MAPDQTGLDALNLPGRPAPLTRAPRLHPETAFPVHEERRYGRLMDVPLSIGAASVSVLAAPPPDARRTFLFIVNTHATLILYVSFGNTATLLSVPINPGNGAIGFDAFVPQNEIFLIGNGAAVTGTLSYANERT